MAWWEGTGSVPGPGVPDYQQIGPDAPAFFTPGVYTYTFTVVEDAAPDSTYASYISLEDVDGRRIAHIGKTPSPGGDTTVFTGTFTIGAAGEFDITADPGSPGLATNTLNRDALLDKLYVIKAASAGNSSSGDTNVTFAIDTDASPPPDAPPNPGATPGVYDEDLVFLGDIDDALETIIKVELHGTGSGLVRLSRDSPNANPTLIQKGNWIKVTVPQIWTEPIFLFQIETVRVVLVSEDEEGGEELVVQGRGALIYFNRVKAWKESFVVPGADPIPGGIWHGPASTGNKAGQILMRSIEEWQHVNRPAQPIPLVTIDFTYSLDSDGNTWTVTPMTDELSQGYTGESGMVGIMELINTGELDIIVGTDMDVHAYNSYGRDLTSATFAAGKVRFAKGVNIAERLERTIGVEVDPTHTLVQGQDDVYAIAISPTAGSAPDVEGFVQTFGTDAAALEEIGLSDMRRRIREGETVILRVKAPRIGVDPDDLTGLYLPGPPGSDGQYWIGDSVTLHTGAGFHDFSNVSARVMAITIAFDKAGNLKAFPELKATSLRGRFPTSAGYGGVSAGASSASGAGGGGAPAPPPASSTLALYQKLSEKGVANGYASLDGSGDVPDAQIPAAIARDSEVAAAYVAKADDRAVAIVVDGGASAITTGIKAAFRMPAAGHFRANSVLAPRESGSIVFDVWKDTHTNAPPTVADTITAAAKPTISAAQKSEDTTLTGWTTTFAAGDWIVVNVDSVTTLTLAVLTLYIDWT